MTTVTKQLSEEELAPWLLKLEELEIDCDRTEIDGLAVFVSEDSSLHSADVEMTLSIEEYGITFKREGRKEISYDQWVDTHWSSWRVDH